jgi:hypothetical protein
MKVQSNLRAGAGQKRKSTTPETVAVETPSVETPSVPVSRCSGV